jgi:D-serine deaminase-like pyridoxal phosphate-dependent protein
VEIVSAGGSGTYTITAHIAGVTEIEAGGGIFCDLTYQSWGVTLEPAIFVYSTVTSRPEPDRVICDAGFKTLPRGYLAPQPVGIAAESMALSAEHGIIQLSEPDMSPGVGETIDLMVGYGDSTVFLHDRLYGVRDGVVEAAWDVQGRGKIR